MMNRNDKYRELRERYPEFIYEAYHHEVTEAGLKVWFDFRMGDVVFHPEALIERRSFLDFNVDGIDCMVFDMGMIELISYWKCACPPTVKVLCGSLSADQVAFWKKLYWNGLGEFYYTNGIAETQEAFLEMRNEKLGIRNTPGAEPIPHSSFLIPHSYLVLSYHIPAVRARV